MSNDNPASHDKVGNGVRPFMAGPSFDLTQPALRESHDDAVKTYFALRQLTADAPQQAWGLAACENALIDSKPDSWFTVTPTGNIATVYIRDNIGCFDQSADLLIEAVEDAPEIHLYINSRGGDSDGALRAYRAIYGRVKLAQIQGNCFSAAVTLAVAAKHIRIESGARMMLHRPCLFRFGTSDALRQSAGYLDRITADVIGAVVKRTGLPLATVQSWFEDTDTYFDASQAIANKLADEIFTLAPSEALPSDAGDSMPATTEQEREFFRLLRRFDALPVGDKARFYDDFARWSLQHVREA